ncbi:class I SAM-dependent methyltransferase [Phenylobacterium aquaticum]|uniref:class I SAM-dependent methyltransferase n=1 Tax=Phenylobacterium aquaticum TaxID=1763816 RepID=UPI001F5D9B7B|nr:SAM-dependent methyltransferase [Phenylobacterium aquaticum]MCI3134973.1 class I SAM-dependent methyltransferase [Phenylobacterium aquaticum]
MLERQPSRTALGAAGYRAAHQVLEDGAVFRDPFARAMLGSAADAIIAGLSGDPGQTPIRLFMAARSRFAEDHLAAAVARGVRQAVVLGAGLDTLALRNPHTDLGLKVFEVDHPETQAWKRRRQAETGLPLPAALTFVAVDFERENLSQGLAAAGFVVDQPAVFIWLGVVPYLGRAAITATLGEIARAPGAEVVLDYSEPLENYPPDLRAEMQVVADWAATMGEPWLSHFAPVEMSRLLDAHGLSEQEDLDMEGIGVRYLGAPQAAAPKAPSPHVIWARRTG